MTPRRSSSGGCKLLFIQPVTIGDVSGSREHSFDERDWWPAVSHARTLMRGRSPRREHNCRHPRTSMIDPYCSGALQSRPTGAHLLERSVADLEPLIWILKSPLAPLSEGEAPVAGAANYVLSRLNCRRPIRRRRDGGSLVQRANACIPSHAPADVPAGLADCGSGYAYTVDHRPTRPAADSDLRDEDVRLNRRAWHCLGR